MSQARPLLPHYHGIHWDGASSSSRIGVQSCWCQQHSGDRAASCLSVHLRHVLLCKQQEQPVGCRRPSAHMWVSTSCGNSVVISSGPSQRKVMTSVCMQRVSDNSTRPKVAAVCSSSVNSALSHYSVIFILNVFLFTYSHTVYIRDFWTGRKASLLFLKIIQHYGQFHWTSP